MDVPLLLGGEALLDGEGLWAVVDLLGLSGVVPRGEGSISVCVYDEAQVVFPRLEVLEAYLQEAKAIRGGSLRLLREAIA